MMNLRDCIASGSMLRDAQIREVMKSWQLLISLGAEASLFYHWSSAVGD